MNTCILLNRATEARRLGEQLNEARERISKLSQHLWNRSIPTSIFIMLMANESWGASPNEHWYFPLSLGPNRHQPTCLEIIYEHITVRDLPPWSAEMLFSTFLNISRTKRRSDFPHLVFQPVLFTGLAQAVLWWLCKHTHVFFWAMSQTSSLNMPKWGLA